MDIDKIIEEISQFYDIKQRVSNKRNIYYITQCDININIGIKYTKSLHKNCWFNKNTKILKEYIDRNILLIDKINEIFEFTVISTCGINGIRVGSYKIYFQHGSLIYVSDTTINKNYYDVCDVIEFLKERCPECIKPGDIKIALKD